MAQGRIDKTFLALAVILVIIVGSMFFFGLRPKENQPEKGARWLYNDPGLAFENFGIAYTAPTYFSISATSEFSMVMAVRPALPRRHIFRFLVAVHGGDDARQLVIGQWPSRLW